MAACLQLNAKSFRSILPTTSSVPKRYAKPGRISCSAASPSKRYTITLLPGDGIGPEVISVAKNVLNLAASLEGPLTYSLTSISLYLKIKICFFCFYLTNQTSLLYIYELFWLPEYNWLFVILLHFYTSPHGNQALGFYNKNTHKYQVCYLCLTLGSLFIRDWI